MKQRHNLPLKHFLAEISPYISEGSGLKQYLGYFYEQGKKDLPLHQ